MCEQTPVDYKDGDIVWVKLGPCWWPGEVQELTNLPQEWLSEFKKPPIAAVKFFDEDAYEYVKSIDKIYSYNCTKKNEFIKKGLDLYRAKNSFMDKFPADVTTAEKRTDGDPNIIDSPLFSPEKKTNFAAILFGTPKVKKGPKKPSIGKRVSASTSSPSSSSSKATSSRTITHPRFLGHDDHEVRILVQSPSKTESNEQEVESTYNCTTCGFTTSRIDVIVSHNKSHIQGVYNTPTFTTKKGKKSPMKKGKKVLKMTRSKTSSIVEDLALIEKGIMLGTESSDDEEVDEEVEDEPKRKRKKNKRKPKKANPPKKEQEIKTDIRVDLLAEWDEDDSEEGEETNLNTSSTAESDTSMTKIDESNNVESTKKEVDKSCFDFEEEEEESEIIGTSVGRKIPRVIPPAEKAKSLDPDVEEASLPPVILDSDKQKSILDPGLNEANLPTAEDDVNRSEHIKEIHNIASSVSDRVSSVSLKDSNIIDEDTEKPGSSEEKKEDPDEEAFKDILESTSVPDLPEIPHSLKYEQNFHNTKTIKFPDKPTEVTTSDEKVATSKPEIKDTAEVTTKLINPKKRFVKSFEDFEQQWNNEQRKLGGPEQQHSSEQCKQSEIAEEKLNDDHNKSAQLEQQVHVEQEEKSIESEKELELEPHPASIVEVSKLKTQLMSKLEHAEKLQPLEQNKNKRYEMPRQSRSLRERILEKQRDEKIDDPTSPKSLRIDGSASNRSNTKMQDSDIARPKSPSETKGDESEKDNQLNLDASKDMKSIERSGFNNEAQNDAVSDSRTSCKKSPKLRRLSLKMPEMEEMSDIEQMGELSEFDETEIVTEQAKIMEVEQTKEVLQVQQVVLETPSMESQTSNENQTDLVVNQSEICNEQAVDDLQAYDKQQDSEKKDIDNIDQQVAFEDKSESMKESSEVFEKESELPKEDATSIKSDIKHSEVLQFSETEVHKEMDELMSMQFGIENSEHDMAKDVNSEIDSQSIPTSVSFSCAQLENQNSNIRIDSKDSEDLSALTTLATVSELTTNLDMEGSSHDEKSKIIEGNLATVPDISTSVGLHTSSSEKSKITEGNLTFVTEDDLADGQVEIANVSNINQNKSKPMTLSSFSVDFADPNQTISNDVTHEISTETSLANTISRTNKRKHSEETDKSEIIEKSLEKVFEDDSYGTVPNIHSSKNLKLMSPTEKMDTEKVDIEAQIPSLVVCSSKSSGIKPILPKKSYLEKVSDPPEYTSSSKLLEILTDGKPKSIQNENPKSSSVFDVTSQSNRKIDTKVSSRSTVTPAIPISKGISKFDPKNSKFVIKSAVPSKSSIKMPISKSNNKPIILSEKIIKPVSETESVSVQKVTSKRINQDIEDIDTFIIQKPAKKLMVSQDDANESIPVLTHPIKKQIAPRGKAKILQQTIIKPAGEVVQPITTTLSSTTTSQPIDDNMFDINSMPIVLGDQILTAESIENMPVVLSDSIQSASTKNITTTTATVVSKPQSDQIKLLNKSSPSVTTQPVLVKTYPSQKLSKGPRFYPAGTTKIVKSNPAIITRAGKSDKFIIVPPGTSSTSGSKYTVGKRPPVMKRSSPVILPTPTSTTKVQSSSSEPTGNKIMIVTNQQGQQSRVLLTPAQQKLLGYQSPGSKLVKNTLKGNILQKVSNTKTLASVGSSKVPGMISHAIVNSKGEIISTSTQNLITSDGQVLMSVKSPQIRGLKTDTPKGGRKIQLQSQKVLLQEGLNALKNSPLPGQHKTIVIKNQQGQIVKKFQGTDDALLEQQVAEQVQAIKASGSFSAMKAKQDISTSKLKPAVRRSYPKKTPSLETSRSTSKPQVVLNTSVAFTTPKLKTEASVPPLAPISPKRSDALLLSQQMPKMEEIKVDPVKEAPKMEQVQQKPLNQLIIQDALGNQTTITEGQILALPSGETIDGHPQSYMLVTLDESGNLAPLNNEALLSLDPNLCLGGDLSNMVLQIDDGSATAKQDAIDATKTSETNINNTVLSEAPVSQNNDVQREKQQSNVVMPVPVQEQISEDKSLIPENVAITNHNTLLTESIETSQQSLEAVQTVTCSIGSDPNQQLIITGDPISTQKFIESLTEGNPDLANLLASAEGNILIQTDEQQILINTDAENQMLLPVNAAENLGVIENSESDSNPIFAAQPSKNQDILAAALADTDVLQQEQTASPAHTKVPQSQLSPNGGLYPSGVANVLGTTLSLSSPIMTPLEVPSSNNKKIPDEETDILTTEVPKNVDLPITITDPNISQTVAQQQVASLIANELTSNLELPLAISDQGVPLTSADMNSPTYVYSLPTLDETVDMHPKTFSGPISMPLLTEEPQETPVSEIIGGDIDSKTEISEKTCEDKESTSISDVDSCLQLGSSVSKSDNLFETSTLPTDDNLGDSEKLQTANRTFLGATIESEEGLCTLGGAMCSSLSEPPPDMFDLSIVNSGFGPDTGIKEHIDSNIPETDIVSNTSEAATSCQSKPIDCDMNLSANEQATSIDEDYNKYDNYDADCRNDGTPLSSIPLNSESSSPAVNIDENSCEIPVQPQIVTDLSSSSFDTHETTDSADFDSNKRISSDDSIENEKKKSKFD